MSDNHIEYNHIHHVVQLMADGGAVYTLSKQPDSTVAYNYLHDISTSSWADYWVLGLYFDEGSSGYAIHDNVHVNAPGLAFNGTQSYNTQYNNDGTDSSIINGSGIESAYADIKSSSSNADSGTIDRSGWTATASSTNSGFGAMNGIDGDPNSRWVSGKNQTAGDWYQVDMGQSAAVSRVQFAGDQNTNGDYPVACDIFISADGVNWGTAVASVTGNSNVTIDTTFPAKTGRYLKIVITQAKNAWWDVRDFYAFASSISPNAVYKIVNANSGKNLDVSGASAQDGASVIQWTDNGGDNQKWTLSATDGGYYKIVNVHSGKNLDVYQASAADGSNVVQWTDNGGANQQWKPVDAGGGYYQLENRNSGKLLDVNNASVSDNASVIQWTNNGGTNQKWQLVPIN